MENSESGALHTTTPHFLFPIPYSLFPIPHSPFAANK